MTGALVRQGSFSITLKQWLYLVSGTTIFAFSFYSLLLNISRGEIRDLVSDVFRHTTYFAGAEFELVRQLLPLFVGIGFVLQAVGIMSRDTFTDVALGCMIVLGGWLVVPNIACQFGQYCSEGSFWWFIAFAYYGMSFYIPVFAAVLFALSWVTERLRKREE